MGLVEIATLVGMFVFKVVLPAIGGGAVAAAAIPDRPHRGGALALVLSKLVNLLGFNFGHATNE
jgi:hypothetical protein